VERRLQAEGLEALRGKRVAAFAGLANNEQFFRMLREAGIDLVFTRGFPDHHRYRQQDLGELRNAGADAIVVADTVAAAESPAAASIVSTKTHASMRTNLPSLLGRG